MRKWKHKETKYPENIEQIHNYDLKELFENITKERALSDSPQILFNKNYDLITL